MRGVVIPRPSFRVAALAAATVLASPAGTAFADEPSAAWSWLDAADARPEASRFAPDLTEDERALALIEGRRSVVTIAFQDGDAVPTGDRADAAGAVVSADGVVATAWEPVKRHAAKPKAAYWVRVGDGAFARAVPVGRTWLADVALLRLVAPRGPTAPVHWSANPAAALGKRCVAIGAARGHGNVAAAAVCGALSWADPQQDSGRLEARAGASARTPSRDARAAWLRFPEALATAGGEGSPVFDPDGRCVGLVAVTGATIEGGLERVMVRPAALLVPMIERCLRDGGWRVADPGFALGPPPLGNARFQPSDAAVPIDVRRAREAKQKGGALIASVLETGPAFGVLWPGDVVLAIDGRPVFHETPETWIEPLLALRADTACRLTVWRGGARELVRVEVRAPAADADAQAAHDAQGPREPAKEPPPPRPRGRGR